LIGTGSSGTQAIQLVAEQAGKLTVFLRTANFTVPARNHPLSGRPRDLGSQQGGNPRRDLGRRRQRCRGHPDAAAPAPVAPDACGELHPERRRKLMEEHWGWGDGIVMSTFADVMLKSVVRTWRSASTRGFSCSASRGQAIQDLGPARLEMGRRPRAQHSDRRAGDHRLRGWRQAREIVWNGYVPGCSQERWAAQ